MRIVLASQNRGKLKELVELLAEPRVQLVTLAEVGLGDLEVDETGTTFEDNARLKAEAVARLSALPALADDSGLEVDALGGRPGVWSRRYAGPAATDRDNNLQLLAELGGLAPDERRARFRCVLALAVPDGVVGARTVLVTHGSCEGRIADACRGGGGFGYDPLFVPDGWERTLAEGSVEEKQGVSHRAQAARRFGPALRSCLDAGNWQKAGDWLDAER